MTTDPSAETELDRIDDEVAPERPTGSDSEQQTSAEVRAERSDERARFSEFRPLMTRQRQKSDMGMRRGG